MELKTEIEFKQKNQELVTNKITIQTLFAVLFSVSVAFTIVCNMPVGYNIENLVPVYLIDL